MLSRKIIVQNITNLTDARYFAAWGVDYLSYNMTPESEYRLTWETIEEIIGWVEGPKTLIEANSLDQIEHIDGHILSTIYSSLPLVKEAFFRTSLTEVKNGLPNGNYIIKYDSEAEQQLSDTSALDILGCTLYLDITEFDFKRLNELPSEDDFGLVIQGGEEEKVGVKSYDDLDILYDWLLD